MTTCPSRTRVVSAASAESDVNDSKVISSVGRGTVVKWSNSQIDSKPEPVRLPRDLGGAAPGVERVPAVVLADPALRNDDPDAHPTSSSAASDKAATTASRPQIRPADEVRDEAARRVRGPGPASRRRMSAPSSPAPRSPQSSMRLPVTIALGTPRWMPVPCVLRTMLPETMSPPGGSVVTPMPIPPQPSTWLPMMRPSCMLRPGLIEPTLSAIWPLKDPTPALNTVL